MKLNNLIKVSIMTAVAVGIIAGYLRTGRNSTYTVVDKNDGGSTANHPALNHPLASGLRPLPVNLSDKVIGKITLGQSNTEIDALLGPPSDQGDNPSVLSEVLEDTKNCPNSYYRRYLYKDDELLVLVFSKDSSRLCHLRVYAWSTRIFF